MNAPTPFLLGYLAALIECDASIHGEKRVNYRRATIEFEVSSRDMAERIADLIGAESVTERRSRPSADGGPYAGSVTYRARVRGAKAREVLRATRPFLSADRGARVDLVLAADRT